MEKFRTPRTGGFQNISLSLSLSLSLSFCKLLFKFDSNTFNVLEVGKKLIKIFQFITPS